MKIEEPNQNLFQYECRKMKIKRDFRNLSDKIKNKNAVSNNLAVHKMIYEFVFRE